MVRKQKVRRVLAGVCAAVVLFALAMVIRSNVHIYDPGVLVVNLGDKALTWDERGIRIVHYPSTHPQLLQWEGEWYRCLFTEPQQEPKDEDIIGYITAVSGTDESPKQDGGINMNTVELNAPVAQCGDELAVWIEDAWTLFQLEDVFIAENG